MHLVGFIYETDLTMSVTKTEVGGLTEGLRKFHNFLICTCHETGNYYYSKIKDEQTPDLQ